MKIRALTAEGAPPKKAPKSWKPLAERILKMNSSKMATLPFSRSGGTEFHKPFWSLPKSYPFCVELHFALL